MTGHVETDAQKRVKKTEGLFSGKQITGTLSQNEMDAQAGFLSDGGSAMLTEEFRLKKVRGVGQPATQEQAIAGSELSEMKPRMTALKLFRRRFTRAEASVDKGYISLLGTDVSEQARVNAEARKSSMAPLSRRQRKHEMEIAEKPEIEAYQKAQETVHQQFVEKSAVSSAWAKENVLDKKVKIHTDDGTVETTQEELFKEVLRTGDCSNLEVLDPVLRNLAASKYMEAIAISDMGATAEDAVNAMFKQGGVAALMNPLFRLGISIMSKGGQVSCGAFKGKSKQFFAQMEDLCNQRIMSATMYSSPGFVDGRGSEPLQQNKAAQIFMAKNLLLAHLGGMQKIDTVEDPQTKKKTRKEQPWQHGMATAFAHCSRVAISLPTPSIGDDAMLQSLMKTGEGQHGFHTRSAATHGLTRKRKEKGSKLVEKKVWPTNLFGQFGLNVAVGGLDNDGVPGKDGQLRKIKNDGSGGHIYMHVDKGDESSYTGLLVGFESDAPGVYNQTGHKHGPGNPEFMSSFGGLRVDEIGDKYGGRVVDCSVFDGDILQSVLSDFESKMQELLRTAHQPVGGGSPNDDSMAELMNLCDMLSGKQMTTDQLRSVIGDKNYTRLMASRKSE